MRFVLALALLLGGVMPAAPELLQLSGDVGDIHDPAVIRQGDTWYVFSTNPLRSRGVLPIHCSNDMITWHSCGTVFRRLPAWAHEALPRARGAWAPDISYFNGLYHLYYAVSIYGKNTSVIGLATTPTLDQSDPRYQWKDEGMVVQSEESDNWNAIDPNLAIEDEHNIWLCWGSYWSGLKMRRIDPATGKFAFEDTKMYSLAARSRAPGVWGSVEAAFLFRHEGWWYLFASFDFCCRGVKSNYYVVVGRSQKITGPYKDSKGKRMLKGGGTVVVKGSTKWKGPGHEAVLEDNGKDYLFFHAYDGVTGQPVLQIETMEWENGWPRVAPLP